MLKINLIIQSLIRQTIAKEENGKVLGLMKGESGEKNDDKTCWIKSKSL